MASAIESEDGQPQLPALTETAISNLVTMGITSEHDPWQCLPPKAYMIPLEETRLVRARLTMEEALETVKALGIDVSIESDSGDLPSHYVGVEICELHFAHAPAFVPGQLSPITIDQSDNAKHEQYWKDLEQIIDGCCDLIYVATGTLMACGVPDCLHLRAVCIANHAKFPNGKAIVDENGKYRKPEGWSPPPHRAARQMIIESGFDLKAVQKHFVDDLRRQFAEAKAPISGGDVARDPIWHHEEIKTGDVVVAKRLIQSDDREMTGIEDGSPIIQCGARGVVQGKSEDYIKPGRTLKNPHIPSWLVRFQISSDKTYDYDLTSDEFDVLEASPGCGNPILLSEEGCFCSNPECGECFPE